MSESVKDGPSRGGAGQLASLPRSSADPPQFPVAAILATQKRIDPGPTPSEFVNDADILERPVIQKVRAHLGLDP